MLKASTPAEADVFNDSHHSTGKASIKETTLKESNGEIFSSLNLQLLLTISSLLLEIRSTILRIPFPARFLKYTDLPPIQIN